MAATGNRILRIVATALLAFVIPPTLDSQTRLLDDFESLQGWKPIVSDGAKLAIADGEGKNAHAMVMEFEFTGGSGYAIARKDFPLALPENYEFTFDMKADAPAPVNNFEFKLLDSLGNVWWIKKLNVEYPREWTKQRIKKRHITFAWGPSGGGEIRTVAKIEFVISVGTGGKGKVLIDNFRFEPIDDNAAKTAQATFDASSMAKGGEPEMDPQGTLIRHWKASGEREWLSVDFHYLKEIGGLMIDWGKSDYASSYEIQLSDDGEEWSTVYTVAGGNGGRDYVYLPEKDVRVLKIVLNKSKSGKGYDIERLEIKGPDFSSSANDFLTTVAGESPKGMFPKYFLNQQSYWTVVGSSGDTKEALINELGTIEVDKFHFSLEPFLFIGKKLVTWNDVALEQSLEGGYLPIPSVQWKYGGIKLTVRAFSAGVAGKSMLIATYRIENGGGSPPKGKLFVALRPFQVNPPWQFLNGAGGVARIDSVRYERGLLLVEDKVVIPISDPSGFGATDFNGGDITEYLRDGTLPSSQTVRDPNGFASAALEYDYDVPSGATREFHVVVPFHAWSGSPTPNMRDGADIYVSLAHDATVRSWESALNTMHITLPSFAQPVINTIKSNLAYILINRDGPGIQPGSRSYERSWIRDGSLTSTALLEMGVKDDVKEYLDWYSRYQYPNGKIPCVVDQRGADPTPENDSHGEYLYALMQYYDFTKDTAWLRSKFENVVGTVRYIQSLRAERKTDVYKTGTPEQRACYGLVPESISHEGYSAKPMHSYWDDFFTLRGLKDATTIAKILGEKQFETEFAAERDDCRKDLYSSMCLAMKNKNIDYIPGCVELGDFDATSTTIGINPLNEMGNIPEPQLHNTFDKYYNYFVQRRDSLIEWNAYTPYENRIIGSFVYLGQKQRAHEALDFFMKDRRPAAWNQWAEVVYRDPATPKFIGDMPHTWCGSDFIRSVRAMFVYERESDGALVVAAGLSDAWVRDSAGVHVGDLPTYYGNLSYDVTMKENKVKVSLRGDLRSPPGKIVMASPLSKRFRSAMLNGKTVRSTNGGREVVIDRLPSNVELLY